MQPAFTGSGGSVLHPTPTQTFPNNPDLVNEISNAALLKELLPTLEKFKCLEAPVYKGRRSPWVRAFCDLYHPAGPWGRNKFKNVPDQTSKVRHSFKSYKIPKILELLEKCQHLESSEPHKQLYNKLKDFKSKEIYYNRFMEACKDLAIEQTRKQPSERSPIPKSLVELTGNAPAEQPHPNNVIILDFEGREDSNVQDQGNVPGQEQNKSSQSIEISNQESVDSSDNDNVLDNLPAQEQNNSVQNIEIGANQENDVCSETIQEQGTDSNSTETNDINSADHENTGDLNVATADDKASFGNDFGEEDTFEETNGGKTTQYTVESSNTLDETTLKDQVSRNDTTLDNGSETSGEKRVTSSSEMPSPKRQRLETNKPVSDESREPSSPYTKEVSATQERAVSPDIKRGESKEREQLLNRKREKLSNMLKQRESRYGQEDKIIEKLHKHLENIDEELFDLIMAEE